MTLVIATALGSGLGLLGLVRASKQRSLSIAVELAWSERQPSASSDRLREDLRSTLVRLDRVLGAHLAGMLRADRRLLDKIARDLRVTNTSLEELCRQSIVCAIVGGLIAPLFWAAVALAGIHEPLTLPVWVLLVGGVVGGLAPALALRSRAKKERRKARKVIGTYLDLVVLCLAGGMGIESALLAASEIGTTGVIEWIHESLLVARDSGETPWSTLARVGDAIGVRELAEIASAVGLAGTEGARVRSTLITKSASIRRHELAESEIEANTLTERLFLPGVLLLVGFLIFIGYPALARISAGF